MITFHLAVLAPVQVFTRILCFVYGSNQDQFSVHHVMQVGVKTVFGVRELVSSFLVTKCCVKCHLATHYVSFVAARYDVPSCFVGFLFCL